MANNIDMDSVNVETENLDDAIDGRWFRQQMVMAKDEAKQWQDVCKEAWREYLGTSTKDELIRQSILDRWKFPMYWSDTQTLLAATYSKTPKPISKRLFDTANPVLRVAAILKENVAKALLEKCAFDEAGEDAALEYLNGSRSSLKVTYTSRIETQIQEYQDPATGAIFPQEMEVVTDEKIHIRSVCYDEVLFTPSAKTQEDITWKAYKLYLTKSEAKEMFGEAIANSLPYGKKESETLERETYGRLACVWEVWDKKKKKVFYMLENDNKVFGAKEDPYNLPDFFPDTNFIFNTKPNYSLFPTPDFHLTKPLYRQLDNLNFKISQLIDIIRPFIAYDKSVPNLENVLGQSREGDLVAVDLGLINEKGGLSNVAQYFDLSPFVNALNNLTQIFEFVKRQLYEIRGISDVIRGTSDPVTTATAEKIKGRFASLRFSRRQRAFQKQIAESLNKMVLLAFRTFQFPTLVELSGADTLDPDDQQYAQQAIEFVKYTDREYTLEIETDSTILFADEEEKGQKFQQLETIGQYLSNTATMLQTLPQLADGVISLLMTAVRSFDSAKGSEGEIEASLAKVLEKINQPPMPPPPDPQEAKNQIEMQKVQLDAQYKQAQIGIENQKLQLEAMKISSDSQIKQAEMFRKEKDSNVDLSLKQQQGFIESQKLQVEQLKSFIEQQKIETNKIIEDAKAQVELLKIELDSARAQQELEARRLDTVERLQEEERLRADQALKAAEIVVND